MRRKTQTNTLIRQPGDIEPARTDSERYAELRKLVEAYQNAKNYPEAESLLVEIRNWSHR